ncbi:hypothetical protein ABIG06_007331 [Bradyrhizobium sp. USDA 326]|uniref:hypothetical protein n=1 Tax=unclassified Bradyrhizobium TaxID=2631580 RepID=UPI003513EA45
MSEKRQRQKAVRCRVSAAEEAILNAAARAVEQPVATFIREAALKAASPGRTSEGVQPTALTFRNFLAEIQRIGLALRRRHIAPADAERIVRELQRLQILVLRLKHQADT